MITMTIKGKFIEKHSGNISVECVFKAYIFIFRNVFLVLKKLL